MKTNNKQPGRLSMLRCGSCARKLEVFYYMDEIEGSMESGYCESCMEYKTLSRYLFEPRRKIYTKQRSGGGERKRAGKGGR